VFARACDVGEALTELLHDDKVIAVWRRSDGQSRLCWGDNNNVAAKTTLLALEVVIKKELSVSAVPDLL